MTKTEKIIAQFKGHEFQTGSYKTPEFKTFARKFKNAIQEQLGSGDEIVSFNTGHFDCSGFIRRIANLGRSEKYIYFSISDVRFFRNEWIGSILVRTAKGPQDYTGGRNQYTDLKNFGTVVDQIFEGHAFTILK